MLVVKASYHNELAITWRTIGTAENQPDYFQRALTEYKAAEHQLKLAKNHVYRASVKNNEAVVLSKLGRFKEAHKHLDQAREITVRFKHRTLTAQFDSTRAELLIAEGKFKAAEAVARRAATALEKAGHRCWLADALILQAIALARLEKQARAQVILQRAIEVAHEADALNKAGLAALTMIEEVDRLSPDTLQAAYQQAREWLADSQSLDVLSRLNAAAGKLAATVRRELSRDEAVDLLLTKPFDIDQRLLEYEHDLIKQALIQSDGKVINAANLVGKSYQGLAKMIETKHPDLIRYGRLCAADHERQPSEKSSNLNHNSARLTHVSQIYAVVKCSLFRLPVFGSDCKGELRSKKSPEKEHATNGKSRQPITRNPEMVRPTYRSRH